MLHVGKVMKKLIHTTPDLAVTFARLGLGLFMLPHGVQKALGWFGGHGIEGTVGFMSTQLGIPPLMAYLAIAAEFLGGLGLVVGLLSRVAAFGNVVVLAVAAISVHSASFFGGTPGGGWSLHFLGIVLGLIVMIRGGGSASVDLALSKPDAQPATAQRHRTITT